MRRIEEIRELREHIKQAYKREYIKCKIHGEKDERSLISWYGGQLLALNFVLGDDLQQGMITPEEHKALELTPKKATA
jgi:hypothetical protein